MNCKHIKPRTTLTPPSSNLLTNQLKVIQECVNKGALYVKYKLKHINLEECHKGELSVACLKNQNSNI